MTTEKLLDGTPVEKIKIGDYVGFKSDVEQSGKVIGITSARNAGYLHDGTIFTLENKSGFRGDYIRGKTTTDEFASDCWTN